MHKCTDSSVLIILVMSEPDDTYKPGSTFYHLFHYFKLIWIKKFKSHNWLSSHSFNIIIIYELIKFCHVPLPLTYHVAIYLAVYNCK